MPSQSELDYKENALVIFEAEHLYQEAIAGRYQGTFDEQIEQLIQAADKGHALALIELCYIYQKFSLNRFKVYKNKINQAHIEELEQGVSENDDNARVLLAFCLKNSIAVEKDEKKARKLLEKAAEKNTPLHK